MKKTKCKRQINKAFIAFFDDKNSANSKLRFAGNSTLPEVEKISNLNKKADVYFAAFKKIFLFLPGVLILHLACVAAVSFYKDFGINFQMIFWFVSGILMVWAGIGDLKNRKHFLLPLSVILSILPFAILFNFLSPNAIEYSVYFFPLFFAVPILAKDWIDGMEKHFD